MGKAKTGLRATILIGVGAVALAACGGSSGDGGDTSSASGEGQTGGTLNILTNAQQILHLDPQRNYTGEDLAFASAYLTRTLTQYTYTEGEAGWTLQPDMATDTGTASDDNKTWTFTIRDGVTFEDGSPVTCEDLKYGISRTFASTVITDGPSYAIQYLNVPSAKDGSSVYKGPYDKSKANDTAAFDKAVSCDGSTITFKLKQPVPDFNQTVTLTAFAAVPEASDTKAAYDNNVVSDGPYKVQTYDKGSKLVLVRNDNYDESSDPFRTPYPDQIVMYFGVDPAVIDQRVMASQGDDATAISRDAIQPQNLAKVFNGTQYADRAYNGFDPYSIYVAVNTQKVTDVKQRQAILAAWPRQTTLTIAGGAYAGTLADGVIKSNFAGYEPTNLWSDGNGGPGLLGAAIPDNGDPEYAKQLIKESGKPMPTLNYQYAQSPTADKAVGAVVQALAKAGIKVVPEPIESGQYYGVILDPNKAGELMASGWGPDWGNASTIIPPLFTPGGGFDVSLWDDATFNKGVDEALVQSGQEQIDSWNQLNADAVQQGVVVPTRFSKTQIIAGTEVGGGYIWAPYGSWPYGALYIKQ
jgi:peptide/nickel transport system substrate-binding protein